MNEPETPRALAFLIAFAAVPSQLGSLNLIEISNLAGTWEFPNSVPGYTAVAVLVGGRPGIIYTTKFQIVFGDRVLGEVRGSDVPFTTEIKRVNIIQRLDAIAGGAKIIEQPGHYTVRLLANERLVADTDLEIRATPRPPTSFQQPS